MDVLTDVMRTVRVQSHLYGRAEFTAPWGIAVPGEKGQAGFFFIRRGSCWLEMDAQERPIPLAGGDFVFLPHGDGYILRDALDSAILPVERVEERDELGPLCAIRGGGAPCSSIWGCFRFEDGGRNPLLDSLPPMIHVRADDGPTGQWLQATLQFVASEVVSARPGAEIVANRLTDILFVHAIRAFISGCAAHGCRASGWLRALADPKIGRALRLIHEAPDRGWTVESLAEAVSMSRSAFAAQFTAMVGEPPLRYVTAWRMKKACHMLVRGEPIGAVARAVGYESDAAFNKAFRRQVGVPPGDFRARARSEAEHAPSGRKDAGASALSAC